MSCINFRILREHIFTIIFLCLRIISISYIRVGTSMAAYAYFMVTKQDYYLPDVRDREFLKAFWKGMTITYHTIMYLIDLPIYKLYL